MLRYIARTAVVTIVAVISAIGVPAAGAEANGSGASTSTNGMLTVPSSPANKVATGAAAGDFGVQAFTHIVNLNSAKCLVTQGFANGSIAFQYDCHSEFLDQYWQLESVGGGFYRIRNLNSQKCLVVRGFSDGSKAFQYDCLSFIDQHWAPVVDTTGVFAMLKNRNSGKCLVVQGFANGSQAFQYTCHPELRDQWWYQS